MISSRFAYAFSAGLVAAINPCGFALLPTYLAYFLGIDNEETSQRIGSDLGRAIKVGAALTAGFLTVFAIMGVLWGSLASVVKENIPWAGLVIGVLLIVGGIAMLRGYEPTIRLPKIDKGGSSRALGSIYVYGISYAIASLSSAVRFLSCEPLLGPLDLTGLLGEDAINWVIVGGESGHHARPMDPEWVRAIREQCRTADVPFFFKQWGGRNKKEAGRTLDHQTWDQMPLPA